MKNYIIAAGLIIILCYTYIFSQDTYTLIEQKEKLNAVTQDMANAAALYFDTDSFMQGNMVFNYDAGLKAAEAILKDKYNLGSSLTASSGYFTGDFTYIVSFYDDSGYERIYTNGIFDSESEFTYHHAKHQDIRGTKKTIDYPSVYVEIQAPEANFQAELFTSLNLDIKSVARYVYDTSDGLLGENREMAYYAKYDVAETPSYQLSLIDSVTLTKKGILTAIKKQASAPEVVDEYIDFSGASISNIAALNLGDWILVSNSSGTISVSGDQASYAACVTNIADNGALNKDIQLDIYGLQEGTPIYSCGEFIEMVFAADGAYPENGKLGSYWYIKQ